MHESLPDVLKYEYMKKQDWNSVFLLLGLALAVSCSSLEVDQGAEKSGKLPYTPVMADSGPAVSIDGKAVAEEELLILGALQEKEIVDEFVRKYRAVPGEGFWQHSFEGDIPIKHLLKWTVYRAVWVRLAQEMAVEQGLRSAAGLEDKKEKLREENQRRLELKEKGEDIYGPDQYTLEAFYPIDEQSLELALIQTLESKEILRDEGRGRDRRIYRIERMKMAFRQLLEEKMRSCNVRINEAALQALITPESSPGV